VEAGYVERQLVVDGWFGCNLRAALGLYPNAAQ
jgi:hypothetical protein